MTIKQSGGVFGRNPKFNNVEAESLSIAGNAALDAGDIGSSVQAYDANTAKLNVAQTFTETQTFGAVNCNGLNSTANIIGTNIGIGDTFWLGWGNFASRFTGTGGGSISVVTNSLTAGTWDTSQNYSPAGNIIMANGKGIDFSATGDGSGTSTSELFDDYEEGTWTPSVAATSGFSGTATVSDATYIKAGRVVTVHCRIGFSSSTGSVTAGDGFTITVGSLPYAKAGNNYGAGSFSFIYNNTDSATGVISPNYQYARCFITATTGTLNRNGGVNALSLVYESV